MGEYNVPKNRKRASRPGAKATAVRTKFKIGGRKSGRGAKQMSETELNQTLSKVRKRDRNKLRDALAQRGMISQAEPVEA